MFRAPVACLVILAVAAGCLASPPEKISETADPLVTSGGPQPLPESREEDERITPALGANLTACQGGLAALQVPLPLLEESVPPTVTVLPVTPVTGVLRIDFYDCEKVAIDGLDVGKASISFVSVRLEANPPGFADDGYEPWWLVEVRTNDPSLRSWLEDMAAPALDGSVTSTFTPVEQFTGKLSGEVESAGEVVYTLEGSAYNEMGPAEGLMRLCYGSTVIECLILDSNPLESVGDGPGKVSSGSSSAVARIVGTPEYAGFFAAREFEGGQLRDN